MEDFGTGLGGDGEQEYFDGTDPELIGIEDPNNLEDKMEDLAAQWLEAKEAGTLSELKTDATELEVTEMIHRVREAKKEEEATQKAINAEGLTGNRDPAFGGQSARTAQIIRFQAMSYGVQQQVVDMINNPQLTGTSINTKEIYAGSVEEAVSTFGSVIQGSPESFARELSRSIPEGTDAARSRVDISTAFSMLGKTSGSFADSGSDIYAGSFNEEKQAKQDDELVWALQKVKEFANQTVTGNHTPAMRSQAVDQNEAYLLNKFMNVRGKGARLIDPNTGLTQVTEDGVEKFQSTIVPMAFDLPGMTSLQNANIYGSAMGTGLNFEGYEALFPQYDRDAEGRQIFDQEKWEASEAFKYAEADRMRPAVPGKKRFISVSAMAPSPRQALYPTSVYGKEQSAELYSNLKGDYKKVQRILRRQTTTLQDELYGNNERSMRQNIPMDDERSRNADMMNEAAILDLDRHGVANRDMTVDEIAAHGKGSPVAGMHGERGISESDRFMEAGGLTESDLDEVVESVDTIYGSDQERYMGWVEELNPPDQRSPEWHLQRKGKPTGSIVSNGLTADNNTRSVEALARNLAGEQKPKVLTDAMVQGIQNEDRVKRNFIKTMREESGEQLSVEEAYYSDSKQYPGMGASPDGYVFDKQGKSQGLLELKYLQTNETMWKSRKEYEPQLQWQMAMTGETQVHFYRQLANTDKYLYDLVKADPGYQKKLIKGARAAMDLASGGNVELLKSAAEMASENAEIARGESATVFGSNKTAAAPATVFNADAPMGAAARTASDKTEQMYRDMFDEADAKENKAAEVEKLKSMDYAGHKKENAEELMLLDAIKEDKQRDGDKSSGTDEFKKAVQEFSKGAGTFAKGVGKALGRVLGSAVDDQADIEKLALATGSNTDNVWGFINAAGQEGMLSQEEVGQTLKGAQNTLAALSDPTSGGADMYAKMQASLGQGGGIALPDYETVSSMSAIPFSQMIYKATAGMKDNDARKVFEMTGTANLYTARQAGMSDSAFNAIQDFDSKTAQNAYAGQQAFEKSQIEGSVNIYKKGRSTGLTSEQIAAGSALIDKPIETVIKMSGEVIDDSMSYIDSTISEANNPEKKTIFTVINNLFKDSTETTVEENGRVVHQQSVQGDGLGTGGR